MKEKNLGYKKFIEERLRIVDKNANDVPFILNAVQNEYLLQDYSGADVILKARQQGFSSLILAIFTVDFLIKENHRCVIVADRSENAIELLEKVKFYIKSYEEKRKVKVPLKYNSKYELFNEATNSKYTIGTAENTDFGRSKTINNLHLSEFAFYPHPEKFLAGALQAVVPNGRIIIETTANGFNFFKTFWDECRLGIRPFKPLFYGAKETYDDAYLAMKRQQLKELFPQEYPNTPEEAFLTSGIPYFDKEALQEYLQGVKAAIYTRERYV